jgi:hypothetical protein
MRFTKKKKGMAEFFFAQTRISLIGGVMPLDNKSSSVAPQITCAGSKYLSDVLCRYKFNHHERSMPPLL